jgi:hypothetical protein
MQEFPVLVEKEGDFVAHFKSTVVIQPRSTVVLAGALALPNERFASTEIKNSAVNELVTKALWLKEKKAAEK